MSTLNRKKAKNLPCPTRTATEAPRGQTAVNYSNIENILETVIAPDDVSLVSDNTGTAMRFEKMLDGRNVAITITSTKKSTLTLKSAWIINQKSGGRTPSASADTLAGTSETNGRSSTLKQSTSPTPDVQAPSLTSETGRRIKTTSTSSISQNAENVNSESQKSKKFALPDTDSDGNALSNEQRAFFSRSKITDAEGRLLSLYHGSNAYEEIHVFRRGKNGYLGSGIYLTDSESYARKYADKNGYKGRICNVYANASSPLEVSTNTPAKEILTIAKSA